MIKENQKLFNRLNVFTDAAISVLSVIVSYMLVFNLLDFDRNYPLVDYIKISVVYIPIQLITYACIGLYDSFRTKNFPQEFNKLVWASLADGILMFTMLYIVHIFNFSRAALLVFLVIDLILVGVKRFAMRKTLRALRQSGYNKRYVLVVGDGEAALQYLRTIREDKSLGLECVGYVGREGTLRAQYLGGFGDILSVLEENSYDEVVCALDEGETGELGNIVEACELSGTKISVVPQIYKYMSSTPTIDVVGGIPLMNIRRIPLDNIGNAFLKRAVDIVGSCLLLIPSIPIMLVCMAVIKITMGGSVIFKQQRVGLNKRIFTMYKLKSMRDNDSSDTAWSTDDDPRKTRFGAFMRKFSIDELPQLFNVLKGDMSLVGPRPEIPYLVNTFKDKVPMYMIKHQVKPGMTGLAQINGYRGDTSIDKRIELDIKYIETWTIFLDLSIMLKTVFRLVNSEKLSTGHSATRKKKKYKAEKYSMTNVKKTDYTALAIFFPAVIALGLIPILMHATIVVSELIDTYRIFKGTDADGVYLNVDVFSQCKAFAVVLLAMIMLVLALVCCVYLFRRVEKRSLVYVGASVVYVVMALISAACSNYTEIAFNGVYDRAEGFYTTACYFVLFLFTMYAFKTTQNFRYVILALFFCVGVNAVLGIFQATGNNLLGTDWLSTLVIDRDYKDMIELNENIYSTSVYGALYHYNYVGSFTGMIVPLFTTLLIFDKRVSHKIAFAVFDALAIFLLMASTARSGIVAVAAAIIVGIVIFWRVIISHWKASVSVVGAVAVAAVGANFALGGALFERIPSLFSDVIELIAPAEGETDLYSTLPLREISYNSDGSLALVAQTDTLNITFDRASEQYLFTDSEGESVEMYENLDGTINPNDERYSGLTMEFLCSSDLLEYDDTLFVWFYDDDSSILTFMLFGENTICLVDPTTGERVTPVNAEHIGFEGKERIGSSRGYIWSRTIPMLKNCLITGYGADTFAYEFPQTDYLAKYYSYDEGFYITVDKAHNMYLQIFFSNGLIALIAFLGICLFYLVDSLRLYALRREYRMEQIFGVSVMLAVVGYLTAGMFNDSVVSVAPVFFILLGTGCALNTINRRMDKNLPADGDVEQERPSRKALKAAARDKSMQAQAELAGAALAEIMRAKPKENAPKREVTHQDVEQLLERVKKISAENGTGGVDEGGEENAADNSAENGAEGSEAQKPQDGGAD